MAPTPTPVGIQTLPYQTPQQQLIAQAFQPTGGSGVDIGALLNAANSLGGLRNTGAPAVAATAATPAAAAGGRLAGAGKAGAFLGTPVGRAGLYGAGGILAGQLANKLVGERNDTTWDEAGVGALSGAGVGAGLGSLVLPGPGTAIGAGVGALAGGLLGKIGPKDKGVGPANEELARQLASVDKLATRAGLSDQARSILASELEAQRAGAGSKSEMKAAGARVASLIPQLQAQAQADSQQAAKAMLFQAAFAPMLGQQFDRAAASARDSQAMMNQAADSVSGPLADAYRARASQFVTDADQANVALAAQAMLAGAPKGGGQLQLAQQLLGSQQQAANEKTAKSGSTLKDAGQFLTGTGISDNLVQWAMMSKLMSAKSARMGATGGI